ncbi:MAG TPA: ABC transporter permease [Acidimicrobiales bacterium]|nr:ABC transporter permease [Acidimicrobiales bacterium]
MNAPVARRAWRGLPGPARGAGTGAVVVAVWALLASVMQRGLPLGIVLRGVVFGSLIALLAIGVVLVYRANRIVNFAQAELGSVAAVLAIEFKLVWGWNYFVAIGTGFAMAAILGAIIDAVVIRRFHRAPRLILTVATIGLAQILKALSIIIPLLFGGLTAGRFETPFEMRFDIHPQVFNGNHVMVVVLVPLIMIGLIAFLRFTDYGIAIRASAENGDRANLLGIPVKRLSTLVWAMAGFLSATAVILRIPLVGFASFQSVSGSGNALLLRTLAAAVIGRMESLPRTVVAAIGIGIFQEAAAWQYSDTDFVDALLVVVILAGLFLQRDHFSRIAESGISTWKSIREVRPIPRELRNVPEVRWATLGVTVVLTTVAVTLPLWASPSQEQAAALIAIYAIVALSLLVLTGWAGHISLGQFALVGFGGAATGVLYGRHGWDLLLAIPAGVVFAAAVAVVIGLPALRIRGLFLAVTTLAFAVTAETFFLEDRYVPWLIEQRITRPALWGRFALERGWQQYFFCLVGLLLAIAAVRNLRNGRTGRAIIAVRDNELNAEAATIDATRTKLLAFALSGGLAGFAGGLYVVNQQGLFADAFGADTSIRLFSMVVIGGLGSLPGAVLGAIYVRGAEFFLPAQYELLASGMGILLLLMFLPEGLGGLVYRVRDGFLRWVARRRSIHVPSLLADSRVDDDPLTASVSIDPSESTGASPQKEEVGV